MLTKWGSSKKNWEDGIREITGIQVRLVFFFWEVNNMVSMDLLPDKITLECDFIQGWLPVVYQGNISYDLKHFVKKKLIRFLFQ